MGPGGKFAEQQSILGVMESFFWGNVLISCETDESVETSDAYKTPWSDLKPESQLDFYGDVHLDFLITSIGLWGSALCWHVHRC